MFKPGELEQLVAEVSAQEKFDGPNFADSLSGNPWDLPDSQYGWRRAAQDWGVQNGLVEPRTPEGNTAQYIGFTPKGLAFRQELHARGLTLIANRVGKCLDC